MKTYVTIVEGDLITIQRAAYIEDGFYITVKDKEISLFEIPPYGGDPQKIENFDTLSEAIKSMEEYLIKHS